jgi:hypothetical protein
LEEIANVAVLVAVRSDCSRVHLIPIIQIGIPLVTVILPGNIFLSSSSPIFRILEGGIMNGVLAGFSSVKATDPSPTYPGL